MVSVILPARGKFEIIDENINIIGDHRIETDPEFTRVFHPNDVRFLVHVSHNNMKHAMKQFVIAKRSQPSSHPNFI